MKIICRAIAPLLISSAFQLAPAAVTFTGAAADAVVITPTASTGLEAVYVLPSTDGVTMEFTGASASARWSVFSNMGGAYAQEAGTGTSLPCRSGDMGYIVEDNGRQTCFWVVDYSTHELNLESIVFNAADSDCSRAAFDFTGNAEEIAYFTINGRRTILPRDLELTWQTLAFDENSFSFTNSQGSETLPSVQRTAGAPAAFCNTSYVLSGDRFLNSWGRPQSIESETLTAYAVDARTRATQTVREADNEIKDDSEGLGGSAPCEIKFEAAVTDAAVYTQWEISRSQEFDILENSFNELEFTYTFTDQGTYYVRFTANNADATCPYESEVYEVSIGESRLDIPNAFSPEASPGTNDEWKVSYKSLVDYECHIFNRWGKELFSSTDPSQGWDGKHGGKYVPAGVYFYVIKATGSDGKKYNKSGDINIINYKIGDSGQQTVD